VQRPSACQVVGCARTDLHAHHHDIRSRVTSSGFADCIMRPFTTKIDNG
jgi:hypothetical protein